MKPKAKLSLVTARHINSVLPDLHYTAIVSLPVIDTALLCLGLLDVYESNIHLTPRRNGQKLYVRAASSFALKQYTDLVSQCPDLAKELFSSRLADREFIKKLEKKVTFVDVSVGDKTVHLPTDCIIGHIVPRTVGKNLREWHIGSPELLNEFHTVPSKGGIYFLRELSTKTQKDEKNGNI